MKPSLAHEASPIIVSSETERTEYAHYLALGYLREQATKPSGERVDVFRTKDEQHLVMEPQFNDSGRLQIRVSDAQHAAVPSKRRPWEVVITEEEETGSLSAKRWEYGTPKYSLRGVRSEGVVTWAASIMEWRTSKDRLTGRMEAYVVSKNPAHDEYARTVFEGLTSTVNAVSDRSSEQYMYFMAQAMPLPIELQLDDDQADEMLAEA